MPSLSPIVSWPSSEASPSCFRCKPNTWALINYLDIFKYLTREQCLLSKTSRLGLEITSLLFSEYHRLLPRQQTVLGVNLTTLLYPTPKLRMRGAMTPLPSCPSGVLCDYIHAWQNTLIHFAVQPSFVAKISCLHMAGSFSALTSCPHFTATKMRGKAQRFHHIRFQSDSKQSSI